ncbi:MAG: GNAT family N-acetyltransferase [Alphaproteobacteria bacterium]|nr:GNAT family N-acetyltransferase [Alphaproteobacteria bacterium]
MRETALTLDRMTPADTDAIAALAREVSWPHRRDDVDLLMSLGEGTVLRGADCGLHGVAMLWRFEPDVARLGMVMIAPSAQGKGLGRRLVTTLLGEAKPGTVVLLATTAGAPLYKSLGFETIDAVVQQQGVLTGTAVSNPRLRPYRPEDLDAVLAMDKTASGLDRRALIEALLHAGKAAVATGPAGITGFALARPFGRGQVIGPIAAAREADAVSLIDHLAAPGFVRVDRPARSEALGRHLQSRGLAPVDRSPVMVLGPWRPPPDLPPVSHRESPRVHGLAGHALG